MNEEIAVSPYFPGVKLKNFPTLTESISEYYDLLFDDVVPNGTITPRYHYESGLKIGFRDIFYYIDLLYDNRPNSVVDVGCGECVFKKWFPNIYGFDAISYPYGHQDTVDVFDDQYVAGHESAFECGMALGSLHYDSWNGFFNNIQRAMAIVNDRFLFTANFEQIYDKPDSSYDDLLVKLKTRLLDIGYKIILYDSPRFRGREWTRGYFASNGSVRFILAKENQ
jgi:hypothetical protein